MRIIKPWLEKISASNECGTIVAFPRAGVTRIATDSMVGLQTFAGWGTVDVLASGKDIEKFSQEVVDMADRVLDSGGKYLMISGWDWDRRTAKKKLSVVKSIYISLAKKINFVFVSACDPRLAERSVVGDFHELLESNVVYLPYSQDEEWDNLVSQNTVRYDKVLTKVEISKIYELSGGCPYLAKYLWKRSVDGGSISIDNESLSWAKNIIERLPRRWVVWCQNLEVLNKDKIEMLRKLGVINEQNEIKAALLKGVLESYNVKSKVRMYDDRMWVYGIDVSDDFSESEKEILMELENNKKMSREEVARICWGEKRSEDYSEYALDKLMSNLRKKLVSLGISRNYIETVKGVGFKTNV